MSGPDANQVTSIDQVLARHSLTEQQRAALKADLLAREDNACDVLRLAGAQFGLFPQIVSEVLAEIGLGSPPSAEERELIRTQFVALMEHLQEQHGIGPSDPLSDN